MNADIKSKVDSDKKRYELYIHVVTRLVYKITDNLKRIYLDIDMDSRRMLLTAYYQEKPSELELELFDDIVTNSQVPIPDFFINQSYQLMSEIKLDENKLHDFTVFATYTPFD